MTAIIVHGGLKPLKAEEVERFKQGCVHALDAGWSVLERGGAAIDAAESAVRELENDSIFNAGYGSALNVDGRVEMDAAIMDGATLRAGAVGAIRGVCHPISIAKELMRSGEAVLLIGEGAHRFAVRHTTELCPLDALITNEQRIEWETRREASPAIKDTVGCVALDRNGLLAAATSTGGLSGKPQGRIGDSPLVGCGLYADELGGVSLTGDGESIIRATLASRVTMLLHAGHSPQSAADEAIQFFSTRLPGEAGCIVLDRTGRTGFAHHSQNLAGAYRKTGMHQGEPFVSQGQHE